MADNNTPIEPQHNILNFPWGEEIWNILMHTNNSDITATQIINILKYVLGDHEIFDRIFSLADEYCCDEHQKFMPSSSSDEESNEKDDLNKDVGLHKDESKEPEQDQCDISSEISKSQNMNSEESDKGSENIKLLNKELESSLNEPSSHSKCSSVSNLEQSPELPVPVCDVKVEDKFHNLPVTNSEDVSMFECQTPMSKEAVLRNSKHFINLTRSEAGNSDSNAFKQSLCESGESCHETTVIENAECHPSEDSVSMLINNKADISHDENVSTPKNECHLTEVKEVGSDISVETDSDVNCDLKIESCIKSHSENESRTETTPLCSPSKDFFSTSIPKVPLKKDESVLLQEDINKDNSVTGDVNKSSKPSLHKVSKKRCKKTVNHKKEQADSSDDEIVRLPSDEEQSKNSRFAKNKWCISLKSCEKKDPKPKEKSEGKPKPKQKSEVKLKPKGKPKLKEKIESKNKKNLKLNDPVEMPCNITDNNRMQSFKSVFTQDTRKHTDYEEAAAVSEKGKNVKTVPNLDNTDIIKTGGSLEKTNLVETANVSEKAGKAKGSRINSVLEETNPVFVDVNKTLCEKPSSKEMVVTTGEDMSRQGITDAIVSDKTVKSSENRNMSSPEISSSMLHDDNKLETESIEKIIAVKNQARVTKKCPNEHSVSQSLKRKNSEKEVKSTVLEPQPKVIKSETCNIKWSRNEDREILESCKMHGASDDTFEMVSRSDVLQGKTAEQVKDRFHHLIDVFRKALQQGVVP